MKHALNSAAAYVGFCLLIAAVWAILFGIVYVAADIK